MNDAVICLVTIHGIGFQQPLQIGENGDPDIPGYADGLHEHLSKILDESWLCDDPERTRSQHGQNGPVYVQSVWPPGSHCREAGLRRLGSWDDSHMSTVIGPDTRLCDGKGRITHVALV